MARRSVLRRSQQGFSLIEVLVASLILFSAIGIGTLAYRTAMGHAQRISQKTRTASAFYSVRDFVREELMQGRPSGQGEWGSDFGYAWQSEVVQSGPNVLGATEFGGGAALGSFRIILLNVRLDLWDKEASPSTPRSFEYKELIFSRTG